MTLPKANLTEEGFGGWKNGVMPSSIPSSSGYVRPSSDVARALVQVTVHTTKRQLCWEIHSFYRTTVLLLALVQRYFCRLPRLFEHVVMDRRSMEPAGWLRSGWGYCYKNYSSTGTFESQTISLSVVTLRNVARTSAGLGLYCPHCYIHHIYILHFLTNTASITWFTFFSDGHDKDQRSNAVLRIGSQSSLFFPFHQQLSSHHHHHYTLQTTPSSLRINQSFHRDSRLAWL